MECKADVIRHPIFGADLHLGQRGRAFGEPTRHPYGNVFALRLGNVPSSASLSSDAAYADCRNTLAAIVALF